MWGQSFDWQTATPDSQGLSKEKLDALAKVMAVKKTAAVDSQLRGRLLPHPKNQRHCGDASGLN